MTDLAWQMLALGFFVGMLLGAWVDGRLYRGILISKARPEYRTAKKIGSGFYYIVPEHEYNVISAAYIGQVRAATGANPGEAL